MLVLVLDSGIQSVGDSIRGSSDSMTNGGGTSHLHNGSAAASTANAAPTHSLTDHPSNINEQDSAQKKANKIPSLGPSTQKRSLPSEGTYILKKYILKKGKKNHSIYIYRVIQRKL